jgi:hypothetical protein
MSNNNMVTPKNGATTLVITTLVIMTLSIAIVDVTFMSYLGHYDNTYNDHNYNT